MVVCASFRARELAQETVFKLHLSIQSPGYIILSYSHHLYVAGKTDEDYGISKDQGIPFAIKNFSFGLTLY